MVELNKRTYNTGNLKSESFFCEILNGYKLQSGSPALTGAKTNFTPFFSTTGLTLRGKEYKSPAPASYFGAKGTN